MKNYRLNKNAFVDGVYYKAGDTVAYDGEPGPHMIPEQEDAPAVEPSTEPDVAATVEDTPPPVEPPPVEPSKANSTKKTGAPK